MLASEKATRNRGLLASQVEQMLSGKMQKQTREETPTSDRKERSRMRSPSRFYLAATMVGILFQLTESLAGRSTLIVSPRVSSFGTKLFMQAERTLPNRKRSPLFSSASSAAVQVAGGSVPVKRSLLTFRGGSTGFAVTKLAKSFLDDVATSKTKSWAVLVASILLETVASTMSKKARDTSDPGLFLFSIGLNLIRYDYWRTAFVVAIPYAVVSLFLVDSIL